MERVLGVKHPDTLSDHACLADWIRRPDRLAGN
jgi:hypothetical protein